MRHRILLKATLVAAMGAVALFAPEAAQATAVRSCGVTPYMCYPSDECPTQEAGDAICSQATSGDCPVMLECVWATGECPSPNLVRIICTN